MVGTKDPNPYGLHDMHGSLWEFVQDRYEDLTADNKTDPTGPTMGNDRVIRGGDWSAEAQYLRSASRVSANPGDPGIEAANTGIGFRLATSSVAGLGFQINAGLNDAWFNPSTPGQGFFVTVFPDIDRMFLAWFTYDTERPPENVMAQLGEPGHRWLTAFGPYVGDTATLDIEVTSGGVFDSAEPMTSQVAGGTINVQFSDCENGLVTFDITSIDQQGEVPIQRIALDNVANCESLSGQ